jgi:5-methyltetrahydrofolate--homocysteine methyltransferase
MPTRSRCRCGRWSAPAPTRRPSTGRTTRRRRWPKFIGGGCSATSTWPRSPYIDWGPFFQTWDLAGPFPAILKDEVVGAEAVRVYADGQRMLKRLIEGRWLTANAVVGLYPANTVNDDDIVLYTDESAPRGDDLARPAPADREAGDRRRDAPQPLPGRFHRAPGQRTVQDYIGLFAVTAGWAPTRRRSTSWTTTTTIRRSCSRPWPTGWPKPLPSICTSACAPTCGATRPTRPLALDVNDLIAEKYRGIRPAPGYPACPDHSVKRAMFDLLRATTSAWR